MRPASAWSRINRVVEIDSAKRNKVVIKSTEGKAAKSNGLAKYTATINKMTEIEMLVAIKKSTSKVGSGIINIKITETTKTARITSCRPARRSARRAKKEGVGEADIWVSLAKGC